MSFKNLLSESCKCHFRDSNFKHFPDPYRRIMPASLAPPIFRHVSATDCIGYTNSSRMLLTAHFSSSLWREFFKKTFSNSINTSTNTNFSKYYYLEIFISWVLVPGNNPEVLVIGNACLISLAAS